MNCFIKYPSIIIISNEHLFPWVLQSFFQRISIKIFQCGTLLRWQQPWIFFYMSIGLTFELYIFELCPMTRNFLGNTHHWTDFIIDVTQHTRATLTLVVRIWRQILTSKVDPRTVRVKTFPMAVDPWHNYLNEAGRDNKDIYDDFKLKINPLFYMFYNKIFRCC